MNRINSIIREEINRFILSEAIDFSNLKNYSNELNNYLGEISNVSNDNSIDGNLRKFLHDFVVYCVQIIAAINRCERANSLNEVSLGSLSNYGIDLPPELGGNLWQDAKQGYYGTKRFLQRNGRPSSSYGSAIGTRSNQNTNSVPSVKLSQLLQQLPRWQQEYATKNSQYNLTNNFRLSTSLNKILGGNGIIQGIQTEYNAQIRNAQGNP